MHIKSRYKIEWLVTAVAAFFILQCGRMNESSGMKGEWVSCCSDSVCIDVFVPDVSWSKALAIWPLTTHEPFEHGEELSQIVTQYIYNQLVSLKDIRVMAPYYLNMEYLQNNHIDYLLKGEVRESESRIMVTLRLFDVARDTNIWAGTYIEERTSLLSIGIRARLGIAGAVGMREQKRKESSNKEPNGEKSLYTLQGDLFRLRQTSGDADKATDAYLKALDLDSSYTPAWIGLAANYLDIHKMRGDDKLNWIHLAQKTLTCAMNGRPDLTDGYVLLGRSFLYLEDWKQAEIQFRQALKLNPNQYFAWRGLANVFFRYGLYEPARSAYQKALLLNPADTTAALGLAVIENGLGNLKEAEDILQEAIIFHPDQPALHAMLGLIYHYQNQPDRAFVSVYRGMASALHSVYPHTVLAILYAKQGSERQALNEVEDYIEPYAVDDCDLAVFVAAVYSLLGKEEQTIEWLEKAVTQGYTRYPWLMKDANFSPMYYHHRFGQFLDSLQSIYENQLFSYQTDTRPEQVHSCY